MAFEPVYIVDGARSPFLKARNAPGPFAASDLAVQAGRELLLRQSFNPEDLDEVIVGCAAPSPDETNIGRVIARAWVADIKCPAGPSCVTAPRECKPWIPASCPYRQGGRRWFLPAA